ncbi:MAG: glutamine amidotransferase [Methylovirgula sp.]
MCGIVGLFLKNPSLEPKLGAMLSSMLGVMCDRGPDSAGFAVYGHGEDGQLKLTLRSTAAGSLDGLTEELSTAVGAPIRSERRDTHLVVWFPSEREHEVRAWLARERPEVTVVSAGTRMATESAVTTNGAHPFSTGIDECLVHNGSLSNHNGLRRRLQREGLSFATENDTEVAAGYLTWRMRQGDTLKEALEASLDDLDGFYTFVVGDESGFAVLRDPISCKPAVMAETDDYVAFGSEYRVLAGLPGIEKARVFEPEPATVYAWERR